MINSVKRVSRLAGEEAVEVDLEVALVDSLVVVEEEDTFTLKIQMTYSSMSPPFSLNGNDTWS